MSSVFAFIGLESPIHWIIFGIIGILLFGKRLPEMGRYLGKTIIEFKKGMKGLEDEVESTFTGLAAVLGSDIVVVFIV